MCRARHQQDVGTRRFLQSINELQRIGETALDCKLLSRRDRFRQVKHAPAKALRQFAVAAVAVEKIANVAAEIEKYPGIRQQWAQMEKDRIVTDAGPLRHRQLPVDIQWVGVRTIEVLARVSISLRDR